MAPTSKFIYAGGESIWPKGVGNASNLSRELFLSSPKQEYDQVLGSHHNITFVITDCLSLLWSLNAL